MSEKIKRSASQESGAKTSPDVSETSQSDSERVKERFKELSRNLTERCKEGEVFPFPGITPESKTNLEKENEELSKRHPGSEQNIEELLEKFENQGLKVFNKFNGHMIPGESEQFIYMLKPHFLETNEDMDPELKEFIELSRL